jgi:hypothetical protein
MIISIERGQTCGASEPPVWGRGKGRLSLGFGFFPPPGRDPFCGCPQVAPRRQQLDIEPKRGTSARKGKRHPSFVCALSPCACSTWTARGSFQGQWRRSEFQQEGKRAEQRAHQQHATVAVLDVGRMDNGVQQQALRVYQDMALLAFDLLSRIKARGVDRKPPFSALLTLWLSMIAAVGLASCPASSRHCT